MAFFQLLERDLKNSSASDERMKWEDLETYAFFLDKNLITSLQEFLCESTEAILLGPKNSGKTFTAKALGFKLLTESGFMCLYGIASQLDDIPKIIMEIEAYEEYSERTLFILEDCHTDPNFTNVEKLLKLLTRQRENTALLLTTRHMGSEGSMLGTFGKVFALHPEKLRKGIVRNRIKQLIRQPKYASSPFLPKKNDEENQIYKLLTRLPKKNLKVLDLHLQAWNPILKSLKEVDEETVLDYILKHREPNLSSNEAKDCFLPLCAINQYEIAVYGSFFAGDALDQLSKQGLVRYNEDNGLYRLRDSSEAIWHLKAAEKARHLQVEDRPANVKEYVKYHILKYAAWTPDPQYLLRGLSYDEKGLAYEVVQNPGFQDNILRVGREPHFRDDVPNLFYELRMLSRIDLCERLFYSFTDSDLDDVGKMGVDTLVRYLNEFSAWALKGEDSTQRRYLKKSSKWGSKGNRLARHLMSRQSVQPRDFAKEFVAGMDSGRYNVADLADLIYYLNWLKTCDVCELINHLNLSIIKAKFSTINIKIYARLLAEVKRSRCGIDHVEELTPPIEVIISSVRDGTGRDLRDMMNALLMPDRKQLWGELTDTDLQEIISRSTLSQLYNFLEDGLKSENEKFKQLGREIAYGLVNLDLSAPMKKSNLHSLSMFTNAVLMLNPELDKEILEQVLPELKGIIERETNKNQVFVKVSLMLKYFRRGEDISSPPPAATEFLQELTQLNLLSYIQTSENGLSYMMHWAIMTDKEISRKWFSDVGDQIWKDKILKVYGKEAFWIMWNIWKVEPSLVCSFIDEAEISDKIAKTPHGRGLLMLCGVVFENNANILPKLIDNLAAPLDLDLTKLILTLKVLCHHSLYDVAIQFRESIDLEKLSDMIQNAAILENTKKLFLEITDEFKTFTDHRY